MKGLAVAIASLVVLTVAGIAVLAQPNAGGGRGAPSAQELADSAPIPAQACNGGGSWSSSSSDGEAPSPPDRQSTCAALQDPAFELEVDVLALQDGRSTSLVALRATEDALVQVSLAQSLQLDAVGTVCSAHAVFLDAPVPDLMAAAAGTPVASPAWRSSGGGGSGMGGGSDPHVQALGTTVLERFDGGGSFGSGADKSGSLQKDEWILVQAGLTGVDPAVLDDDDSWTLSVKANATLEVVHMDAVGFLCGYGFAALQDAVLSAPMMQVGGRIGMDVYAATVHVATLSGPSSAVGSGRLVLPDRTIPFDQGSCLSETAWALGELAIEVDHWAGSGPAWSLSGAWQPAGFATGFC